jgi:hypothetical protein
MSSRNWNMGPDSGRVSCADQVRERPLHNDSVDEVWQGHYANLTVDPLQVHLPPAW